MDTEVSQGPDKKECGEADGLTAYTANLRFPRYRALKPV